MTSAAVRAIRTCLPVRPRRRLVPASVDTTPPRITVLGKGSAGVSPQGEPLMIDSVMFASDWSDPGATASDVNELGVTVSVASRVQVLRGTDTCMAQHIEHYWRAIN